jgi:hypothetical protein
MTLLIAMEEVVTEAYPCAHLDLMEGQPQRYAADQVHAAEGVLLL